MEGSIHFHQKNQKNVSNKGLDGERQITVNFVVFLYLNLKSKKCLPKFTFHTSFHVAFTPNPWSNLEKCEGLSKVIIFPYLSAKKKELGCQKDQRSLIIMDTFIAQENEEMKQLCAKNNCELVIVPHNLTNRTQPLNITINLSTKKLICNKCNPWYANKVSKQL